MALISMRAAHSHSRARASAAVGVVAALLVCAALVYSGANSPSALLAFHQPRSTGLYWHGPGDDAVTFNGVGPGGSVGPTYHWSANSFSPQGNAERMSFSHDHSALVRGERPYLGTPENDAVREEVVEPKEDPYEGLKPMTYFAKMFPIEKGYSSNLFDYEKKEAKEEKVVDT
ncbi:hypothetical protein T484DRAFT_1766462, partial [Baffinella frigidus]